MVFQGPPATCLEVSTPCLWGPRSVFMIPAMCLGGPRNVFHFSATCLVLSKCLGDPCSMVRWWPLSLERVSEAPRSLFRWFRSVFQVGNVLRESLRRAPTSVRINFSMMLAASLQLIRSMLILKASGVPSLSPGRVSRERNIRSGISKQFQFSKR